MKDPMLAQIKALDVLQHEVVGPHDPRVLFLTMDNESSAGTKSWTREGSEHLELLGA